MGEMKEGLVIKGIGGFYYVQCGDVLHACRARGKFRKDKISPYAGDRVRIEVDANDEGYVQEILPRKNFLVRPPLANLDKLFVVSSVCDPQPSTLIIDKTIAAAELKGIEPVLVFTKTDLSDTTELKDIYGSIGIRCYFVSAADGVGVDDLRPELTGCISAFTGNSGVGKSTLLNLLVPELELATGETSKKLGRGRHASRGAVPRGGRLCGRYARLFHHGYRALRAVPQGRAAGGIQGVCAVSRRMQVYLLLAYLRKRLRGIEGCGRGENFPLPHRQLHCNV